MYTASDLRKGLKIMLDGQPLIITEFDFSKPGKGQAIYNCKLKNMLNGTTMSRSFLPGDRFEKPDLTNVNVRFLLRGRQQVYLRQRELRGDCDDRGCAR